MRDDLRYFEDEAKFLGYAWDAFKAWYRDKELFLSQYHALPDEATKNRFLMLASFYKFLVRDARLTLTDPKPPNYVDYIDETWKYVALMSLIEAACTEDAYQEFHEWLRSPERAPRYPIASPDDLDALWKDYLAVHGATQKAVRFFSGLPSSAQQLIRATITVEGQARPIEYLARLLYRIRSEFLHYARLVLELGGGIMFSHRGKKMVASNLSLQNLGLVFEAGILALFGFKPQRPQV